MPKSPFPPKSDVPLDALTEQALEKLVHLHSGTETEDDWARYEEWKAAGIENKLAADRAEALWEKLGSALAIRPRKGKSIPLIFLAVLGVSFLLLGSGLFGPPRYLFADQKTAVGERRHIVLTDGSQVDIDADTAFDVNVDASKRELTLFTGRVFVTVTPDKSRPFTVRAGSGTVRALGTAFGVRQGQGGTHVIVTESAVRVALPDLASDTGVDVHAGQQVNYSRSQGIGVPRTADTRVLTAWRKGQMIFEGRPLGDVIQEMGRYRWETIVFTDASLKQLLVTGSFDIDDTDGLLKAISAVLPVKITRLPGIALIQRDEARTLR